MNTASAAYRTMMDRLEREASPEGQWQQIPELPAVKWLPQQPSLVQRVLPSIIVEHIHSVLSGLARFWSTACRGLLLSETPAPVDEEEQTFYDSVRALLLASQPKHEQPVATSDIVAHASCHAASRPQDAATASLHAVLVVPEWLPTGTTASLLRAAARLGVCVLHVERPTAATFTALGVDVCPVDSEYAPCPRAAGRVMTLQYTASAITAAVLPTPYLWWSGVHGTSYAINRALGPNAIRIAAKHPDSGAAAAAAAATGIGLSAPPDVAAKALAAWINAFAARHKPNKVGLIGSERHQAVFRRAVQLSDIRELVVPKNVSRAATSGRNHDGFIIQSSALTPASLTSNSIDATLEDVVALGAARMAKQLLESQPDDCIEDSECIQLRREADRLSGIAPGQDLSLPGLYADDAEF
jgi:hypothetical protein